MSLDINIKKELDNNIYLAEYRLDNETWEKEIDLKELMVEVKTNINKLNFDTPVSFYTIDVDVAEDNKEFDVNLSKFRYYGKDYDFYEIETRTCKRKETALEIVEDWCNEYKDVILNNKQDIINDIKNLELEGRRQSLDEIIREASSKCNRADKKEKSPIKLER